MSSNNDNNAGNNLWFHPVLLSLMEGRPVQEELAFQYIQENAATIAGQIKTLSENNLDILAVQIAEWCMKVPSLQMDVNVVSNLLSILNKLGRSEDFHRQCCQLPCCLAKEVMKVMELSSFQVARIASEIFLLQDLLNPSVSCCTKELLNFWLVAQKEENLSNELIVENVNKMLGIVEEFNTLCTFVEAIFGVFSSRFLPLCTDLSLRIFQSQKPLISSPSYLATPNCIRLVQTIEIVGKLFRNFTPLYSECLLTSLTLDPSLSRYIVTLNFFLGRTSGVPVSACKMLPVDIKVYNSVLQTVGQLRPIQLDRQQSWTHLRHAVILHLANNGYTLDPSGTTFIKTLNPPSDEGDLFRRLMVKEEQEANLMPAANVSAPSKFGMLQPPKPRSNAKPGARRQAAIGRGQKKQQPASGSQQMMIPTTVANNITNTNQISYQNYQYQSPESQCVVGILPQVPVISGSSEMVPIVVDQDPVPVVQGFDQVQQVTTSHDSTNSKMSNCIVSLENVQDAPVCDQDRVVSSVKTSTRGAKVMRTPSRTSPRRLQANNPVNANQKGIRYEDDNIDAPPVSRRLRTRGSSETCDIKAANNKSEEGKKINSPRRGRPPKNPKTNGSCGSENDSPPAKGNPETLESNGLKNFGMKKSKSISPNKSSFFNKNKYKKHSTQRHLWLKSRKKLLTSSGLVKGDVSTVRKKKGKPTSMTELPNCFVSLSKLSSSEVVGKRASRKRKVEDSDLEAEEEPPRKLGKKVPEKQKPKPLIADSSGKLLQSQTSESAVKPCVCDGCGEVVPDCNWLTAHIVVCPGMTGAGAEEENENMMVAPEETWSVEQTKMEQEQQPADVQEGEGFVQQPSFAEYPVQASENQTVTGHDFESFPSQGAYVIAPQNPISFGKEMSVDGVSAFEFSLHKCGHCSLVFYTEISLDTHVKNCDHFYSTGTKYEVYVCSKCALHFSDKSTLWFHCQYSCGKSGSSSERETYKCWICQKEFLSELFLARHVLGKHASDSVAFQCLHQQLAQHKKQQLQYQVAKNPPNYSSLVAANGSAISVQNVQASQAAQPVVACAGQNQLTTIDASQISADFFQQATCELYQSSANLLYSQSDSYPQAGSQRIIAQSNGYFQQPQQQQEFSTVSVLPISMSEGQDVYYGVQSQSAVMNSTTRVQSQGDTFVSGSAGESAVVTISTTPGGGGSGGGGMRRAAKGIMYKNVYMQCVVNYHCSHCKTDLSTKALKKEHRRSACFDANSNRFSYLRQYSYLCPYCGEKFPSQKVCRQHQLSVCLVLMGVKTDELNFKQHNCPFCNKKYFNVITLKGHLTLAHKDRVDSTDCGADADDGGNEDLIGGVGGKYSNLIVNNPLVPIPNLEAGPVFSSLSTSPLKVALQQHQQQQQLHQPQMISVVESQTTVAEENACLSVNQVVEPVVSESNGSIVPVHPSAGSAVKSRSKKKSRGKSPVTPQPAGSSLASTRSLRNNPRSSRYHYDDDFCSGEDLDVFEPKLSRSISEKSDRQTRSSSKVEDGKCGKSDCKNGESGSRNRHDAEDDADSDATDDLTVDESVMEAPCSEGQQLSEGSNPFADVQKVEGRSDGIRQGVKASGASSQSLFVDLTGPTVDQVLKGGIDPTAFIEQMSSTSQNLVYASTYASLQPLESDQVTSNVQKGGRPQEAESNSASSTSRSSNNKFIIDNLLGRSNQGNRRAPDKDCGSDESDCQDDFLINIDSSLDAPGDEDDNSKSSGSSRSRAFEGPPAMHERTSKVEKSRSSKQEQTTNLFSATYEKTSRHDRRDESSQLASQTQPVDNCGLESAADDRSPVSDVRVRGETGNCTHKEADEDSGRVRPGVVMDVKKRTILKKLSNSLNMASKRQPGAIGGAKFYK